MGRLLIDAGRLRHRLVLDVPSAEADGAGGLKPDRTAGEALFALVEPAGPLALEDTGFAMPGQRLAVTIRFRPGLAAGQRFRHGERLLVIESAFDPDETGRFIRCLCREEGR